MSKCKICDKEENIMGLPPFCEGHSDPIRNQLDGFGHCSIGTISNGQLEKIEVTADDISGNYDFKINIPAPDYDPKDVAFKTVANDSYEMQRKKVLEKKLHTVLNSIGDPKVTMNDFALSIYYVLEALVDETYVK